MTELSAAALAAIIIQIILCLGIPIVLLLVWRKKTKANLLPALVGAGVFIVFALILESILHQFVLVKDSPLQRVVTGNVWLYALYGCFAAGIFEECGRFFGYKVLLKKHSRRETAITYGIGHGGIEMMILVGVGMISNLALYFAAKAMGMENYLALIPDAQRDAVAGALNAIGGIQPVTIMWSVLERLSALVIQISLSVLVFTACRDSKKWYLFPTAILLHALVDFPAVLFQQGIIPSLAMIEGIIAAMAVVYALMVLPLYKRLGKEPPGEDPQPQQ